MNEKMTYTEAKEQFVQQWGALGTAWGISRTMAQIQAVLLLSPKSRTADDLMEELGISRGNVSMSLKSLIDWGVVKKEYKMGERKEYFRAEKDIWRMATQIAQERRKRELEPVVHMLEMIQNLDEKSTTESNAKEMKSMSTQLLDFAKKGDSFIRKFVSAEKTWFFKVLLKL